MQPYIAYCKMPAQRTHELLLRYLVRTPVVIEECVCVKFLVSLHIIRMYILLYNNVSSTICRVSYEQLLLAALTC